MGLFPGALPAAGAASPSDTLAAAGHTSLHSTGADESRALATKVGTGSSTAVSGQVLTGTGAGTSSWAQVNLTTMVSGVLPVANGGTAVTTTTGTAGKLVYDTGPTISAAQLTASPTLTTPTVADLTNMNHTHASAAQGGLLNGANAITDGTITPAELMSGTGSSWAWTSYTPTYQNLTVGNGTNNGAYKQIGKTVFLRFEFAMGTTSAIGSSPSIEFPITASSSYATQNLIGNVYYEDSGVTAYVGFAKFTGPGQAELMLIESSGTYGRQGSITSTVPITWGTGDYFRGQLVYEAA